MATFSADIITSSTFSTTALKVTGGAQTGYVLTSDASGNATWTSSSTSSTNFANTNLTLNSGRTHNLNGFDLEIGDSSRTISMFNNFATQITYGDSIWEITNSYQAFSVGGSSSLDMLTSEMVVNNGGLDYNFRVEGDTDQNLLFTDASTDRIGIGTNTPLYKLQVTGTVSTTGFRMTNGASSGYVLTSDASGNATWEVGGGDTTTQTTGLTISFTSKQIYNTPASPGTASITNDLTGSQLGIVQKIYHNSSATPSVPVGWVLLGDGIYFTSQLNIIYAEWVTGTRVEYWIIQEQ